MKVRCLVISLLLVIMIQQRPRAFEQDISCEGYSGYLLVPSAFIMTARTFGVAANNCLTYPEKTRSQYNLHLTTHFLPRLEVNARLAEGNDLKGGNNAYVYRDLSASFKLQILNEYKYLPALALGWQDVGGAASTFSNRYIVIGKTLFGRFQIDIGYGFGPMRLAGVSVGLQSRFRSFLHTLSEYSEGTFNFGFRFFPTNLLPAMRIDGFPDLSLTMGYLHFEELALAISALWPHPEKIPRIDRPDLSVGQLEAMTAMRDSEEIAVETVAKALADEGFENVQVEKWRKGQDFVLMVGFENRIFNRYPGDGFYRAAQIVDGYLLRNSYALVLTEKKNNLAILSIEVGAGKLHSFLLEGSAKEGNGAGSRFVFGQSERAEGRLLSRSRFYNASTFRSDLIFNPVLYKLVGTETGLFHYRINCRPELLTPLWKGAMSQVSVELPLYGKGYYEERLDQSELISLLVHHTTTSFSSLFHKLTLGRLDSGANGFDAEHLYSFGSDRLAIAQNTTVLSNSLSSKPKLFPFLDFIVNLHPYLAKFSVGRFRSGDYGGEIEIKSYFHGMIFAIYLNHTTDGSRGGATITVPLSFRRDPLDPWYLRPRLPSSFSTSLSTVLFTEINQIDRSHGRRFPVAHPIKETFYQDRMHPLGYGDRF